MRYSSFRSERISRLGIGTVQFGIPYGINNDSGKVQFDEIVRILAGAREMGVNFIDTARAYGTSESDLGRALSELHAHDEFLLSTKLDLPEGYTELSRSGLRDATKRALEESRAALRREVLDFYLLHRPEYRSCGGGAVWELLQEERTRGGIRYLGVSISRGPIEAASALEDPAVDALQIPFNVFDQRWTGILELAAKRETGVFSRSAYLQGLLVMDSDRVEKRLPIAVEPRRRLDLHCSAMGLTRRELALRYVFSSPGILSTVVGVDSYEQFLENAETAGSSPFDETTYSAIAGSFADVPERIVNPALWDADTDSKENAQ